MEVPKILKTELLYNSANLHLSISPKEIKIGYQRDICTSMFTAALLTIARIWKKHKYPSTD